MARYTGPKIKPSRREGINLGLKGGRWERPDVVASRMQTPPGQHAHSRRRSRPSGFSLQLREKQKVKRMYGVLERQFRTYVEAARTQRGETGTRLLQILESRLDNTVYRLGFAATRAQARDFIRRGKVTVNKRGVTIPSFVLSPGDEIQFLDEKQEQKQNLILSPWLTLNKEKHRGVFKSYPSREDLSKDIDESLIVEYYLR